MKPDCGCSLTAPTDKTITIDAPAPASADDAVLNVDEVALKFKLMNRSGQPNRRAVCDLIRSGAIRLVDPNVSITRWTVASNEIPRFISAR